MGRGSSKAGGGGGAGGAISVIATGANAQNPNQVNQTQQNQQAQTSTPSGITYDQFMQMSDTQKYQTLDQIIHDPNIQVPNYLDDSQTSKVLYALGLNNKPTVVSDSQLDAMQGREIFRTVYDSPNPKVTSDVILDQIRTGDFTQLSNSGGSAHGRALYFATDFGSSAVYGSGRKNPMIMRAKINGNANIRSENSLIQQMNGDSTWNASALSKYSRFGNSGTGARSTDRIALYAIAHGIDGWFAGSYTMLVNRGAITASSQNRRIGTTNRKSVRTIASSWHAAAIVP